MIIPIPGGRRRIDRVLAPDFLDGLENRPIEEVRARRRDAEQEEADLSYLRRLLHGRMDILKAEVSRRADGTSTPVIEQLAQILADPTSNRPGQGRHINVVPSRVGEYRRRVERAVGDIDLSDIEALSEAELVDAIERLAAFERDLSRSRRD